MRSLTLSCCLALVACAPSSAKQTYPVMVPLPNGGIHLIMQSMHSDVPEICIDSNVDRVIELRCDRGMREFTRAPEFRLAASQGGLSGVQKQLHLGEGRFMNAQLALSLATPLFFVRGDSQPLMLAQPAASTPNTDWAYHLSDQSLWYSVDRDDTHACWHAAVIFRSADGTEKRACIDGWSALTLHPELPFAAKVVSGGVRLYRLDPEAGTAAELGDVTIADPGNRPLFDLHRGVLYVQTTDHRWMEVAIGSDDSLTMTPSALGKLIYSLQAIEHSSLEGGDTLLWGVDAVATAILMKEGRPVARFTGPKEAIAASFIQAGHDLFLAWIENANGARTIHLDKAVRESLE